MEIILGVVMFTLIVLVLSGLILAARAKLVNSGDVVIDINDEPQNQIRKARKDLGVSMMMYGHVYVAQISLGAQLNQTVKAIQEAEAYPGPSLIIAYSPCEEHGYDLALSHDQMRQLTATGFWPLYRFDPRRADEGKLPLALDSRPPSDALAETLMQEQRFRRLNAQQPEVAEQLWKDAAADLQKRYDFLAQMAGKAEKPTSD